MAYYIGYFNAKFEHGCLKLKNLKIIAKEEFPSYSCAGTYYTAMEEKYGWTLTRIAREEHHDLHG